MRRCLMVNGELSEEPGAKWKWKSLGGCQSSWSLMGTTTNREPRRLCEEHQDNWLSGVDITRSPHQGPKAAMEHLEEVQNAGQTVLQYHLEWRSKSGISEKSAVCRAPRHGLPRPLQRQWAGLGGGGRA